MILEYILHNNWKDYLQRSFKNINPLLPKLMNYGRLSRKIIYFHVCILSYDPDIDEYIYFVKPSLIKKYWKIFEDDISFEEHITSQTLLEIQKVIINTVKLFREKVNEEYLQTKNSKYSIAKIKLSNEITLKFRSTKYNITVERWNKLKSTYIGNNFDEDVFRLMLRYDMYGKNKEGIDLSVDSIYSHIKSHTRSINILEAFAGAINNNLPNYCSLFYDIEKDFGSQGSFFQLKTLNDYDLIIANPPYITSIMDNMSLKLLQFLEDKQTSAQCIVIIPDWRTENEVSIYRTIKINKPESYERSLIEYKAYTILRNSEHHHTTYVIGGMQYYSFFNDPQRRIRSNSLVIFLSNTNSIPSYQQNIFK